MVANQEGAVLLLVILVLALISVLVLSWGQEWRTEVQLASNFREAHQCRRLAEAGVYYAMGKLVSVKVEEAFRQQAAGAMRDTAAPSDIWQGTQKPHRLELPGGVVEVRVEDEGGKINLNRAPQQTLENLFTALKVPLEEVRIMVDSIQDWRSRGNSPRPYGAKSDYYLSLEPPYVCKNSNFENVEELSWVRGFLNSPLIPRLSAYLTVLGVNPGVNINTAPLPVLQAVGLPPEICQTIIATRQNMPFRSAQEILQLSPDPRLAQQMKLTFNTAPFFTIKSTGRLKKSKGQHTIKAVVRLDFSSPSPWQIVSWVDDFPG